MIRGEVVKALEDLPYDADVLVNVGGYVLDVADIRFDRLRHAIVLELFGEDAAQAMRRFLRAGRPDPGGGNSL
jgi:hypothetical protein